MTQQSPLAVLVFGPQSQLVNSSVLTIPDVELPVTAEELLRRIGQAYPVLKDSLQASGLAVDHQFARGSQLISEFKEIALIGLVSGG